MNYETKGDVYKQDNITIINDDCMNILKQTPDKYYDLCLVDPPYGINADKAQNKTAKSRIKANGKSKAGRGWKLYKDTEWDEGIPKQEYWDELFRVSKNQIVWGANYMTNYLNPSMGWIIWDKGQRDFSLTDGEMAWTSFNKAMRIFTYSRGAALAEEGKTRFHPTQKPVKLYNWIYANYAKEGQKILDTHLGSGSNAIAAHYAKMGEFVGCELDEDYFKASTERIYNETRQMDLF